MTCGWFELLKVPLVIAVFHPGLQSARRDCICVLNTAAGVKIDAGFQLPVRTDTLFGPSAYFDVDNNKVVLVGGADTWPGCVLPLT